MITQSPRIKVVEKGRNIVMQCSASGDPEPTISWFKDYLPLDDSDSRITILPTGN